jgi:hypothetical protein
MNDSTPGDSFFLAASFNFMRELSAEKEIFQPASFPAKKIWPRLGLARATSPAVILPKPFQSLGQGLLFTLRSVWPALRAKMNW